MRKGVERTYLALYTCLALGVVVCGLALVAPTFILKAIGGAPDLVLAGSGYLSIRFYVVALSAINFVFHGFFRGIGDTKTPMVLSIAGNLIMVAATYGLTYGRLGMPEIGINGAAWALLLGEALILIGCVYWFFVHLHKRKFPTRIRVPFRAGETKLLAAESGKLGIQEFAMSVAMFVFTSFVTHLGTDALAANEVSLNVMSLGFMPAFAFGATTTVLVGQEIGRRNPLLAKRLGLETALLGSLFLLLLGAVEFVGAEAITRLYTSDPEVAELAAQLIRVSAFLQIFDGWYNFFAGGLRGTGDTTFLVRASFLLNWLLFIPLAYLLTFVLDWGSIGAWLALYTFLLVYGCVVMIRFYRTDWLSVKVRRAE